MKKILFAYLLVLGSFAMAQTEPGGPGDPVPIDDYLPTLVVAAVALTVYAVRRNKQVPS